MFVSLAFLAAAQQIVIPLDHPKVIEQPRAPIESAGPLWAAACDGSDDWNKPAPPVAMATMRNPVSESFSGTNRREPLAPVRQGEFERWAGGHDPARID